MGNKAPVLAAMPYDQAIEAAKCHSRRDQAPASRKSRTKGAGNQGIVVEIPDRCPASARIVKQVVRHAVPIEVGSALQLIPACNCRPNGASNKRDPSEIPDRRLTRARIE